MREIKFRVWDPKTKSMFNSAYVDLTHGKLELQMVKDAILMQYTGLKDKQNREIYEGDIVKYWDSYQMWLPAVVSYVSGCFCLTMESWEGDEIFLCDLEEMNGLCVGIEVIGNVCANPELVKELR